MPTLPPRNLPFSPNGSPRTPSATKRADDRASPSPSTSALAIPLKKRDLSASGILPRQDETTYHRKLRSLLSDHCRACGKWEDIVSTQAAKSIASISRLSAALDGMLVRHSIKGDDDNTFGILHLSKQEVEYRRMDEMFIFLKGIEGERVILQECMLKVVKAASKLEGLSEAAEGLLVEATRAKGSNFTFDEEMWVTWSMDKFVGILQLITSRHLLQTEHLHCLSTLLLEEGCAPGRQIQSSRAKDRLSRDEEDEREEEETDEENDEIDDVGKEKRKRRALIRERVMEEWQALPLLKEDTTGIDFAWFEEICEVEVGRWEER